MTDRASFAPASAASAPQGFLPRLRRWWRLQSAAERYLAAATDTADLEHRARALDRGSAGPAFVTFNH